VVLWQTLDLTHNALVCLPTTLTGMQSLSTFKVLRNQLSSLGPQSVDRSACSLSYLTTMTRLDLSGNKLTELPQALRFLTLLQELVLAGNRFADLSGCQTTLGNYENLQRLDCSNNRLHSLPANMRALKKLGHLNLSVNLFETWPRGVCGCVSVRCVQLSNNFLTSVPAEIGSVMWL